jgi:hypothetical protein
LDCIDVNQHGLHRERRLMCREAAKNGAVPVWNGNSTVACERFERPAAGPAAGTRKRIQQAVDADAMSATLEGVGDDLADDLAVLPAGDPAGGGR